MTWKGGAALVGLGILLGIGAMLLVVRAKDSNWIKKERELVEESIRWQHLAGVYNDQAAEASERANTADRAAASALAELEKLRRKRRSNATLAECEAQLDEYDARQAVSDRAIAFLQVAGSEKDDVIAKKDLQVTNLQSALEAENARGDGWKRHSKRARIKQAFFGIGMAGAGVLVGYGSAQVAR